MGYFGYLEEPCPCFFKTRSCFDSNAVAFLKNTVVNSCFLIQCCLCLLEVWHGFLVGSATGCEVEVGIFIGFGRRQDTASPWLFNHIVIGSDVFFF